MYKINTFKYYGLLIFRISLILLLFSLSNAVVANEILKNVVFQENEKTIEIKADLSVPFSYVKHFPSKRGKIIQIQLKVDDSIERKKIKRRETIKPKKEESDIIRDIIFEGNVRRGPYLVLRFNRIVRFTVEKAKDSQSIVIVIEKETKTRINKGVRKKLPVKGAKLLEVDQLMQDAKIALTNGKNGDAIILFSKLLSMKDHKYLMDAKEYLGLARERNGQLELAKKEYQDYLKIYAKHRRANTVKQRLMTLNARLAKPKRQLKESKRTLALRRKQGINRTDVFGRFSQIFYGAYIKKEVDSFNFKDPKQALLLSFANASWRKRDANKEARLVFSGNHEVDYSKDNSRSKKKKYEYRVRSIYGDYKNKRNGLQVTFGRQSVNSGGVLGRFDGGVLGFKITPKLSGYFVGGYPVDFVDHQKLQTNKPMAGFRLDLNDAIPNWKMSSYYIGQKVDGILNRSAFGADARYFKGKHIFYSLVDYDASYRVVNFLTAHYGWQFTKKTKVDLHFDRRRSPVMLTSNALQGLSSISGIEELGLGASSPATVDSIKNNLSIKYLLDVGMSEKDIRQRAVDNTGKSTLMTFSLRQTIRKDLEFNGNFTLNKYVPGINLQNKKPKKVDEDGNPIDTSFKSQNTWDKVLSTQLIQRNLFKSRDIIIGGLRYSNNKTSVRYEANGTVRYPFRKKWWIDAKMRLTYTQKKADQKDAAKINPKLRLEYRHNKKLTLEGEISTEINKSQLESEDFVWISANFGFRYLF